MTTSRARTWLVLLATSPFVALRLHQIFINPRPFWIHHYDPELIYFFSGGELLHGRPPLNVNHPGIPVQVLTAAILALTGSSPFQIEIFRCCAYLVQLIALLLTVALLARTLLSNVSIMISMAAVWAFLMAPRAMEMMGVWTAEAFFFTVSGILLAALWWYLDEPPSPRRAAALGFALGLCIATKFSFLAWIPALALTMLLDNHSKRFRTTIVALAATVAGFVVFAFPALSQMTYVWRFLLSLATHTGDLGSGTAGFPDPGEVVQAAVQLLSSSKAWHLLLAVAAAIAIHQMARPRQVNRKVTGYAVFSLTGIAMTYLFDVRTLDNARYLLPAAACAMLLVVAVSLQAGFSTKAEIAVAMLCFAVFSKALILDEQTHRACIEGGLRTHDAIARLVKDAPEHETILYGWRSPEPSFALRLYAPDAVIPLIESRYANEGDVHRFLQRVRLPRGKTDWDVAVVEAIDLPLLGSDVVVAGRAGTLLVVRNVSAKALK